MVACKTVLFPEYAEAIQAGEFWHELQHHDLTKKPAVLRFERRCLDAEALIDINIYTSANL